MSPTVRTANRIVRLLTSRQPAGVRYSDIGQLLSPHQREHQHAALMHLVESGQIEIDFSWPDARGGRPGRRVRLIGDLAPTCPTCGHLIDLI